MKKRLRSTAVGAGVARRDDTFCAEGVVVRAQCRLRHWRDQLFNDSCSDKSEADKARRDFDGVVMLELELVPERSLGCDQWEFVLGEEPPAPPEPLEPTTPLYPSYALCNYSEGLRPLGRVSPPARPLFSIRASTNPRRSSTGRVEGCFDPRCSPHPTPP